MDCQKKQLFEFLKRLKVSVNEKKKYIVGLKFKNYEWLLIYLFEMRLIKNYIIKNKNIFIIELAYDNKGKSIINGMVYISQKQYRQHITLNGLQQLINKKIPIHALIETRDGILPLSLCLKRRIGGNVVFWIY